MISGAINVQYAATTNLAQDVTAAANNATAIMTEFLSNIRSLGVMDDANWGGAGNNVFQATHAKVTTALNNFHATGIANLATIHLNNVTPLYQTTDNGVAQSLTL